MTVTEAQQDLRRAYVGGGPGAMVSACVWFAAAAVEAQHDVALAFKVLFFGGFLIYPVSTLICRFVLRRASEASGNPMGPIALESTIAMIGGLFAAWLFVPFQSQYVFPLAAIAVGTHYAVFKTAYGDRVFWVLAAAITGVGLLDIFNIVRLPGGLILVVGLIEIAFGALLAARAWKMSGRES